MQLDNICSAASFWTTKRNLTRYHDLLSFTITCISVHAFKNSPDVIMILSTKCVDEIVTQSVQNGLICFTAFGYHILNTALKRVILETQAVNFNRLIKSSCTGCILARAAQWHRFFGGEAREVKTYLSRCNSCRVIASFLVLILKVKTKIGGWIDCHQRSGFT